MSSCRYLKVKTEVFDLVVGVERKELEREAATKNDEFGYSSLCLKMILCFYFLSFLFKLDTIHCIHSVREDVLTLWQDWKVSAKIRVGYLKKIWTSDSEKSNFTFYCWRVSYMAVGITSLICKIGVILCTSLIY